MGAPTYYGDPGPPQERYDDGTGLYALDFHQTGRNLTTHCRAQIPVRTLSTRIWGLVLHREMNVLAQAVIYLLNSIQFTGIPLRSRSFELSPAHSTSHHPYSPGSVSNVLPTIYDQPDPARLNQYADLGMRDFQHPLLPLPQHVSNLKARFSALNLRQDHLDRQLGEQIEQNQRLAEYNSELTAWLASIEGG